MIGALIITSFAATLRTISRMIAIIAGSFASNVGGDRQNLVRVVAVEHRTGLHQAVEGPVGPVVGRLEGELEGVTLVEDGPREVGVDRDALRVRVKVHVLEIGQHGAKVVARELVARGHAPAEEDARDRPRSSLRQRFRLTRREEEVHQTAKG